MRILRLKLLSNATTLILVGSITLVATIILLFIWFSRDLPTPDTVKRRTGFSTTILDRFEKPIYDIYVDKNRIPVPLSDVPDTLKKATVAIEDKDFYKHQGFDPKGILRSIFNILTFRGIQGGSTLTQQLVKNVLLSSERTFPRKIKEFVLAVQIERKYSKDEILQMYLNEAPYGGTMWGIEAASQGYFGKSVKELTFAQAVTLAGLPQRPSFYSPFGQNPTAYITRAEEVLRRMREDGYISQLQEHEYRKELGTVTFASAGAQLKAPHFVQYVKKQLIKQFGEKKVDEGGLRVKTTLDGVLQEKAETIVKEEVAKLKGLSVSNAALVSLNPDTGEIMTYVGSKDYASQDPDFQGKFDVVSLGLRQPGSALKPITYAVAFAKGYTPSSLLMDVETKFPGGRENEDYVPKNYDGKYRGPVQLRHALGNSINIPAVKLTALVGIRDILKQAYDMGITTLAPTEGNINRLGLSLTLGGGEVRLIELTLAFGVFATSGVKNELYVIEKVTDTGGKVLYEHKKTNGRTVLSADIAFLINHILSDNNARKEIFGENSYLVIPGKTVAAKTGTTDDKRDNWTVGYTPHFVTGVWVGNNDNSPMNPKLASGVSGAAPIWNRLMREYLKGKSDEQFQKSDNVQSLIIDAYAGGLPHKDRPTRSEYFINGTEPTGESAVYKKIKVSKADNGKLANPVEIATGAYDEKDYIVFTEDDPTSRNDKNLWQEGIDKWLNDQKDEIYHPPRDISNTNDQTIVVRIKKPDNMVKVDSNDVEISADGKALKEIKKLEVYIDGSLKKSFDDDSFTESFHFDSGIRKVKVKAYDSDNNSGESEITIGIKADPNSPSPTPLSEASPTQTPIPTLAPTVMITP